jgi:hypothetical protein
VLTQIAKRFIRVDPKYIALAFSLVSVAVIQLIIPGIYTPETVLLAGFNVLFVTASAVGMFESTLKPMLGSGKDDQK